MEPVAGVGLARTADAAGQEGAKLIARVLGPSADVLGQALAGWTQTRVDNVRNIAKRADRKAEGRGGAVNLRVAQKILDDGSYVDDEVMAEYYAGILAASKTPTGDDDMGQPWVAQLGTMSSIQVRLHYLMYRALAIRLHGSAHDLSQQAGRNSAILLADLIDVITALGYSGGDVSAFIWHAVAGLRRLDLIGDIFSWGPPEGADVPWKSVLTVAPSSSGMDLYGWAVGAGPTSPEAFKTLGARGTDIPGLPSLSRYTVVGARS